LRGAVLRALAARDDPRIAPAILDAWDTYDAGERRDALNTLSSRATSANALLDAVASGKPARAELGAFVVRKIESLGDPRLAERLAAEFGRVRASDEARAKRIAALEELVRRPDPTNRPHGREVFARTCEQCHTLFDAGGHVGPDLTGSNRADLAYLLSNVVDPNAVVGRDYLATLVWTKDGRLLTGIEKSRTASAITLASENETVVIARADVEEEKLSDLSTMPEGLLDALAPDEIRDLVAYVQGAQQVPVRATRANAARFFDGRTLAGWKGDSACWSVEKGEIVGKTSGLAKNEFLCSALELGDFRLSLEVRLAGDQGNSGIQFRTRAREGGEVEGCQADIGPGWWGKLYEENGRGLLAEPASAPRVRPGEWNRYVIEARGAHVRTSINGEPCVDFEDPAGARRGIVALQIHSGGATDVRFRAFELEVLD
jgi:putative heme-binding domain-containing protein